MDYKAILKDLIARCGTIEEKINNAVSEHFDWNDDYTGVKNEIIGVRFDWVNGDKSDLFYLNDYKVYVCEDEHQLGEIEINYDAKTYTADASDKSFITEMMIEALQYECQGISD